MTGPTDISRLLQLLRDALAEADACGDTLIAALLTECIETAERHHTPHSPGG
ncbi:hypothetical protein [Sphingomonas rubra]|uniref:Uncharacterized protein n=1 Tax=Sphingomonas rubra TaxID=634430 RepID=A0A1I5SRE6_9SPHN|nr:hypothetical protein [Sphingomonas rubra]SFP72856.1 hypothetical protein SAMN04488241_10655 [Sphingomonas rubra]